MQQVKRNGLHDASLGAAIEALSQFWHDAGAMSWDEGRALARLSARLTEIPSRRAVPTPRGRSDTPVSLARTAAAAANDLPSLKSAIEAFEHCPLKRAARNTVVYDGIETAPVMVVGEAPGADEDLHGMPFVGRSGKLLDKMLAAIGLSRADNLYITNLVYWRPPGNRDPSPEEISICAPFLARQIELKQPKLLLSIGKPATQTLLQTEEGIMRLRGRRLQFQPSAGNDIACIPLLHPSYLLRRPQDKSRTWSDLQSVARACDELGIARPNPY